VEASSSKASAEGPLEKELASWNCELKELVVTCQERVSKRDSSG
jgi:hypothetical protein